MSALSRHVCGVAIRRLRGYPQAQLRDVEFGFGKSRFCISGFATRPGDARFGDSVSARRARRPVSDMAKPIMLIAVNSTNSISHSKIRFLGASALLVAVAAVPISFRADRPSVKANSTLNCYDSAGNYEPCAMPASVSPPQFNEGTTEAHRPARWTTTALYQQAIWSTTVVDQPAIWTTSTVDHPANSTTSTSAARRSRTAGKHPAICGRRPPCCGGGLRILHLLLQPWGKLAPQGSTSS